MTPIWQRMRFWIWAGQNLSNPLPRISRQAEPARERGSSKKTNATTAPEENWFLVNRPRPLGPTAWSWKELQNLRYIILFLYLQIWCVVSDWGCDSGIFQEARMECDEHSWQRAFWKAEYWPYRCAPAEVETERWSNECSYEWCFISTWPLRSSTPYFQGLLAWLALKLAVYYHSINKLHY